MLLSGVQEAEHPTVGRDGDPGGVTCVVGAVDDAGQWPGKERHSSHNSNVQEGTRCLGRRRQGVRHHNPSPRPQNPIAGTYHYSQHHWNSHSAREKRTRSPSSPPTLTAAAPGRTAQSKLGQGLARTAHSHARKPRHHPASHPTSLHNRTAGQSLVTSQLTCREMRALLHSSAHFIPSPVKAAATTRAVMISRICGEQHRAVRGVHISIL